jgi:hypothetical protein
MNQSPDALDSPLWKPERQTAVPGLRHKKTAFEEAVKWGEIDAVF